MDLNTIVQVVEAVGILYYALLYLLPPDKAKVLTVWASRLTALKPILDAVANTKGGVSSKKGV